MVKLWTLIAVAAVALLASCGGGGGNPGVCSGSAAVCGGVSGSPNTGGTGSTGGTGTGGGSVETPSESPSGIFTGTTNTGRTGTFIVLDDTTLWGFYSVSGQPNVIAGMFHGLVRKDAAGALSVPALRDFNLEGLGINDATATASYKSAASLSGTVSYRNSTVTFSAAYDSTYAVPTNQSLVTGTFKGQSASAVGVNEATFSVGADGSISGSGFGCTYSGKLAPRPTGYVYDASISFAGSCQAAGNTVTGIAYYDPNSRRLLVGGLGGGRSVAGIFLGTKQ